MWKKLISLNLVLLLLLTLLPLGAAAESAGLKDDWGETSFNAQASGISSRFLFTEDGEQLTPETFDVSADICSVSWSGRGRVELNGTDLRPGVSGTLTAVRKADGKIFTMPITVYLPSYAYFRTNEFTDAAFITSLDNGRINYADDPALRTVYLIGFDLSAPVNVSGSGEISWQYLDGVVDGVGAVGDQLHGDAVWAGAERDPLLLGRYDPEDTMDERFHRSHRQQ